MLYAIASMLQVSFWAHRLNTSSLEKFRMNFGRNPKTTESFLRDDAQIKNRRVGSGLFGP